MAESFLGELFKNVASDVRKSRESKLDPLELMIRHAQLKRLQDEDVIQAENLKELIRKKQRSSEIIPENDPFVTQFPALKDRTREEFEAILPHLISASAKKEQREKPRPLTSFESQQAMSLIGSGRRLQKISKEFEGIKSQLGPLNPASRSQLLLQLKNDPKFSVFKKDVLQEFNEYRKRITGAQAVFKEIEFLQEASLTEKDPPEVFMVKLDDFIEEADFNRSNLVNMFEIQNKPVPEKLKNPFSFKKSGLESVFPGADGKRKRLEELRAKKQGLK